MNKVIKQILRLKRHREQETKVGLAVAEKTRSECRGRLLETYQIIRTSKESAIENDVVSIQQVHSYVLRMEMRRRIQEVELTEHHKKVDVRRAALVEAKREKRTYELLLENREARRAKELRDKEQKFLDEAGARTCQRRSEEERDEVTS
jgi:flagellar export protein FliJ